MYDMEHIVYKDLLENSHSLNRDTEHKPKYNTSQTNKHTNAFVLDTSIYGYP